MKKICGFFVFLCVAVSVFVYAVEEKDGYLYGDLSIAYNNELPSGLFAKSRNYLPGDTLHISNPFTGEEINVLNLSSLDEDSPCVLMLTTEAANKLGLDFKDTLYVRVSPRTNDFDEIAAGSAMLTHNKDAVLAEAAPLAEQPKPAEDEPKALPAQEPVKTTEVAAAPEPEKKEEPPVAQAESKEAEPVPEQKAEVAAAPAVPKVEPLADLSTLADPLPVVQPEPVEAVQQPVEVVQQPVKKEEPLAEKPVNEPEPEKKSEPAEFAEETLVRTGQGRKSYTTVTTVSETVTDGAALAAADSADDEDEIEEIAVRQKKQKVQKARKEKAPEAPSVYEEPVPQMAAADTAGNSGAGDSGAGEQNVTEETARLPAGDTDGELARAETGFEIPVVHRNAVSEVIPEITEESVKLASNGLKEVPSAHRAVEEFPASRSSFIPAPDADVYEYPQTLSEDAGSVELPVSFVGQPASAVQAAASDVDEQEIAVSEPEAQEADLPVREIPVRAAYTRPAVPAGASVSAEPVVETAYRFVPEKAAPEKPAAPAKATAPAKTAAPAESVKFTPAPAAEQPKTVPAGTPAEVETEIPAPPVPPLAQKTSLTKAEPQQLAPEEKKAGQPKVTEIPVKAETPKRAEAKAAAVEKEPAVKPAKPAQTAKTEKPAKPAAAAQTAKTEKPAVAQPAKTEKPEKKDVKVAAKKESKPVAKKETKKTAPVTEDSSDEEELVYTQTEELMLIPSGGGEQRAYSGEGSAAARDPQPKQTEKKPSKTAAAAPEDDDSDNIIVSKQDVFTLSPTDSIGPDGRQGDGQKVYTPQKQEPKASSSASAGTGKSAGSDRSASAAKPAAASQAAVREKDLKTGNYVQFATCTTDAEAEKIISTYKKYPVIKVLFENRAGYKLLVGPLSEDEKGAVLVRFKSFGYNDAYLRKVK